MPCRPEVTGRKKLPSLVTIPDTAWELSCSISAVYAMIHAGKLDLVRLGPKSSRCTGESVERVAAERVKPATNVPNLKQFKDTAGGARGR